MNDPEKHLRKLLKTREHLFASDYMRARAAARYCGMSESLLAKLRMRHNQAKGPSFIRAGGVILYHRCDLDAWLEQHRVDPANRNGGLLQ